jgi:hypothetical protein
VSTHTPGGRPRASGRGGRDRRAAAVSAGLATALLLPGTASAHQLLARYESPLPLAAYVGGAAIAVALSFVFVTLRPGGAPSLDDATLGDPHGIARERLVTVPRWIRTGLRSLGVVAWLWIVTQAVLGGNGESDVASLFLWTYGWVGVAITCALVGPIWAWLDPFASLYDLVAGATRRLGVHGWHAEPYPRGLGRWPAVAGFTIVAWLELVFGATGGSFLAGLMVAYTILTLAAMAQYGRDRWLARGEVFGVWFRLLGRLAPLALAGRPERGRLRVRRFASGVIHARWSLPEVVLVVLAAGTILYDGVSQTAPFVAAFGRPGIIVGSLLLAGFGAGLLALVGLVMRGLGLAAVGAGLLPIAAGYLIAHYLTSLLIDGQRILDALSDPFQRGWDLLGFAHREPDAAGIPAALVWTVQIGAVVGGHVIGAWAGHRVAERSVLGRPLRSAAAPAAPAASRMTPLTIDRGGLRRRQIPLAMLMVLLTSLTLWSLGQAVVVVTQPVASSGGLALSGPRE